MIGKIILGKSFKGCIQYCLEDKVHKQTREVTFKNRAEILYTHFCYGKKEDLVAQFEAVRALNRRVEKPVMHITLSLAPSEQLERGTLINLVEDLAKEMQFERNQYLAVSHLDTQHQHLHLVVNRVGYDGKTIKDNHNYRKMASYSRKMELKYGLQQVLSPRRYLNLEQRLMPRWDSRKESLRQCIVQALSVAPTFDAFVRHMKEHRYQVQKGLGIAFIDEKGVRIKGSEVGYSIKKLEYILTQKQVLKQEPPFQMGKSQTPAVHLSIHQGQKLESQEGEGPSIQRELKKTMERLLKPEGVPEGIPEPLKHSQKEKKRKQQSLHL